MAYRPLSVVGWTARQFVVRPDGVMNARAGLEMSRITLLRWVRMGRQSGILGRECRVKCFERILNFTGKPAPKAAYGVLAGQFATQGFCQSRFLFEQAGDFGGIEHAAGVAISDQPQHFLEGKPEFLSFLRGGRQPLLDGGRRRPFDKERLAFRGRRA